MRPTQVTVDLSAIAHNTRALLRVRPGSRLCAVVKADAYGHGATQVARMSLAHGAYSLAVALVEEGCTLREAGIGAPIFVLAGNYRGDYAQVVAQQLTPVVGQSGDLEGLEAAARAYGTRLDVHLELDTGMARLGFDTASFEALLARLTAYPHLRFSGLMTHLSHADTLEAPSTARQIAQLERAIMRARAKLPELTLCHILNSGGLITAPPRTWDMVRCGLALYGLQPVAPRPLDLRPALRWTTRPVALHTLQPGDPVSYGSHWHAARESLIATLPVGYADGYCRTMSHKAHVLVEGVRVPVVGTICMDLCMIDVTDVPGVTLDTEVVLLGRQGDEALSADDLALWAHTISYEILARIGPRVPRVYIGANAC